MTSTPAFDGLLDDLESDELTARERTDLYATERVPEPPVPAVDSAESGEFSDPDALPVDPASAAPPSSAAPDAAPATEKLVIVEGQRFLVAATIDNEAIRSHLVRQGFAHLTGAEIKTGTASHDGQTVPTIEFIKRAGTKG